MELVIHHSDFIRIDNNVNNTPRYVIHWIAFCRFEHLGVETYEHALRIAKKYGGKRFHNRQYGGGIAFATFELNTVINKLNSL